MSLPKIFVALSIVAVIVGGPALADRPNSPSRSTAFDGVYAGPAHALAGYATACRAPEQIVVTVAQGRFRFPAQQDGIVTISGTGRYSAMLRGSLAAADRRMQTLPRIDGIADGSSLAGEYGTRWCKFAYQLRRVEQK